MRSEIRRQVREIFEAVLRASESERGAVLDTACGDDSEVRRQVEQLLRDHRQTQQSTHRWSSLSDETLPAGGTKGLLPDRIGSYRILGELGRGGMGIVYLAADPKLKREIALKVLPQQMVGDPERLARFEREAQLLASLNHPNIATIHSLEESDGNPFLTLELVAGDTLSERLRLGPLSVADSLSAGHQVALALEAAHKRQIIHRDLKPGNIMVTPEGQVKVLDFGLAKALRADSEILAGDVESREGGSEPGTSSWETTREGAIMGTPGYMSPEQIEGRSGDHRVDLWAFGCVLFECLSGRRTFTGATPEKTALATLQEEPDWSHQPPETPERVRALLSRCLMKDVKDRLDSATEARHVLEEAIARGPVNASFSAYRRGRIAEWSHPRYRLDKEFVALTLLVDQGQESASGRWNARPERYQDLGELLDAVADPVLVLLGPPGSGKSTLLRRFELDMAEMQLLPRDGRPEREGQSARDERDPITFFLQLNHYRGANPGDPPPNPATWLSQRWQTRFPALPSLESLLNAGRMVLLLDALNEMPMSSVAELRGSVLRWKEFLQRLMTEHPGNRVIFSCRTLDYSAPLSSPSLPVPQIVIGSLKDEQVEQFLTKHSPERGESIWNELQGTPQLEVMRSPYFLSLLTNQVEMTGEIPKGRAELFTGFVRQALRREVERDNPLFAPDGLLTERDIRRITQWKWESGWELPERGLLVPKLSELAYWMQDRSGGGGASQVRIDLDKALRFLDEKRDETIVRAGLAISVLDEDPAHDELLFFHQLLQEYFAGRRLARNPEPERVRAVWRAEEIEPSVAKLLDTLARAETLPELATTGWEETALLAATMAPDPDTHVRGLMETHLALAGRCAGQLEVRDRLSPELLANLQWGLVQRSQHVDADLRARISAGLALGPLGDPRFEIRQGSHGAYLLPPMVEIPGGRYPMGEDEPFEYLGQRNDYHVPRHEVELVAFRIGRFPVTNAEWACFMESGGYEDKRWWDTDGAQRWWSGEGTAAGTHYHVRQGWEHLRQHPKQVEELWTHGRLTEEVYERWKKRLEMTESELEAHLRESYPGGKLREPELWHDDRFDNPLQPVVGVSWYEARAYGNWLSAQRGERYSLPTEAEWEAAARGREARKYAWGDTLDSLRANTVPTRIQRTTPVGVFVQGRTPEGLSDLTGNVNEWTASLFGAAEECVFRYPYHAEDGREDPHAGPSAHRVLRGGSWDGGEDGLRAARRYGRHPGSRTSSVGFRLASVSPASA